MNPRLITGDFYFWYMMYQLVYVSDASYNIDKGELDSIFLQTQSNNLKHDISGFLSYKNGNFLQLLEGEKNKVLQLLEVLKKDARHKNLTIVFEHQVDNRVFDDYSTGFLTPLNRAVYSKLYDYFDFLKLLENKKTTETVTALKAILSKM